MKNGVCQVYNLDHSKWVEMIPRMLGLSGNIMNWVFMNYEAFPFLELSLLDVQRKASYCFKSTVGGLLIDKILKWCH